MFEAGQEFVVPREIEETPKSISHPYDELDALLHELWGGEHVPSPLSALRAPVGSVAATEFQGVVPEAPQFDGTSRTPMKYIDTLKDLIDWFDMDMEDIGTLKDAFALSDEDWFMCAREIKRTQNKFEFMYGGEIKSGSAMHANGMSLTMPPTRITGRSSADSMENFNLFLDSGASRNMVFNPELLINQRDPPAGTDQFVAADGARLAVIGYGDIEMDYFRIPDVYLVRGLTVNLISVGHLATSNKVYSCFAGNECNLMLPDGKRVGGAIRRDNNQYLLRFLEIE